MTHETHDIAASAIMWHRARFCSWFVIPDIAFVQSNLYMFFPDVFDAVNQALEQCLSTDRAFLLIYAASGRILVPFLVEKIRFFRLVVVRDIRPGCAGSEMRLHAGLTAAN